MTHQQLIEKIKVPNVQKIGKLPVVVLPLKTWEALENYLEDLEIKSSSFLRKKIAKARREKMLYSVTEVKRMTGILGGRKV